MIDLPKEYTAKMKDLLGGSYQAYIDSFERPVNKGLRVNTSKISVSKFLNLAPFDLKPVPWTDNGFYYDGATRVVSSHPYYYLGLYYLQESSAMAPAAFLPVEEGDRVLDLCAAPGGKTTQLGLGVQKQGFLMANDVSASRARALVKNIEIQGLKNTVVTCETPDRLAETFPAFFDKILVDAPCSGEGMFRSGGRRMIEAWKRNGPDYFSKIQRDIVVHAVHMLKPGGLLLYSTCTFDPSEDEQIVGYILDQFPQMSVLELPDIDGLVKGDPSVCGNAHPQIGHTVKFFPHRVDGEGHFAALMKKEGSTEPSDQCKPVQFERTFGKGKGSRRVLLEVPGEIAGVDNIRFLRSGLILGEIKNDQLIPSQAYAMTLNEYDGPSIDLAVDDQRALRYLKGESLTLDDADGTFDSKTVLVRIGGFPAGWGQINGRRLKNKLLPAWRLQS